MYQSETRIVHATETVNRVRLCRGDRMIVRIEYQYGVWVLWLMRDQHVIKSYTFKRLIQAIDAACALQLHVNNLDELPLKQYANGV